MFNDLLKKFARHILRHELEAKRQVANATWRQLDDLHCSLLVATNALWNVGSFIEMDLGRLPVNASASKQLGRHARVLKATSEKCAAPLHNEYSEAIECALLRQLERAA